MRKYLYWVAPVYTGIITLLSITDNAMPVVSVSHIDKCYHAVAYFIMCLLWYSFFNARFLNNQWHMTWNVRTILSTWSWQFAVAAGALSALIGIVIEFLQEYVAINRTMDLYDVLANTTGIIVAIAVLKTISKRINT